MARRNVLLVVSSVRQIPGTNNPTGTWLEELAASYYAFTDAGIQVEVASPQGDAAPIDPASLQDPWLTDTGRRFQSDPKAQQQISATRLLSDVANREFDAVYLVGGLGAIWDFQENSDLGKLVSRMNTGGKLVSGVCHGVLGLTSIRNTAGEPIVKGRKVTGVSNQEEKLGGLDQIVPTTPQDRLTALGAHYVCGAPFEPHVVRDGNLFTGQNPASAGPLATRLADQLLSSG